MRKILTIAAKVLTIVIIAFAVILTGILLARSDSDMSRNFPRAFEEIGITLNIFTIGTYVVTGLTILLVIGFSIYNLFVKPKAAVNALIGIAALAVIVIVSWFLSSSAIDPLFVRDIAENIEVTDALSKQVGAGLIATYILAALSVLAIIYAWISKLIKG
ncbi:MAG: hypothetical protein R6V49_06975 [Bacteroidales bacterium]